MMSSEMSGGVTIIKWVFPIWMTSPMSGRTSGKCGNNNSVLPWATTLMSLLIGQSGTRDVTVWEFAVRYGFKQNITVYGIYGIDMWYFRAHGMLTVLLRYHLSIHVHMMRHSTFTSCKKWNKTSGHFSQCGVAHHMRRYTKMIPR